MDGAHQVKRELQAVSDLSLALVQPSLTGWLSAAVLSRQYCSSAVGQQRLVMLTASAVNAAGLGMSEDIGWKLLGDPASRKLLEQKVGTASTWTAVATPWHSTRASGLSQSQPASMQLFCQLLIHCSAQCSSWAQHMHACCAACAASAVLLSTARIVC
jgi:hypothetical protein